MNELSEIFKENIIDNLAHNMNKTMCNTLSGMLMLDYIHRIEQKVDVKQYIQAVVTNLKNFLGERVILDENFSTCLKLFIIAISPTPTSPDDIDELLLSKKNEIIDAIVLNYFQNLKFSEITKIKSALSALLGKDNFTDIIDYITSDLNLFKTMALGQDINPASIVNIRKQLLHNIRSNTILGSHSNYLENAASGITTMMATLALITLTTTIGVSVLPLIILPVTIGALKYLPKSCEALGKKIFNFAPSTSENPVEANDFKNKLLSKLRSLSQELVSQKILKSKTVPRVVEMHEIDLGTTPNEIKQFMANKKSPTPLPLRKSKVNAALKHKG